MHTAHDPVPRPPSDLVQVAIRVPESWLERADALATKLSRPGIVVSRTEAFRAALAQGLDVMEAEPRPSELVTLEEPHLDVLYVVQSGREPGEAMTMDEISRALDGVGARWRGLARVLNDLSGAGYLKRVRRPDGVVREYSITAKGKAARPLKPIA